MSNILWVDVETTGLDPERDALLEVALVATDSNLNILDEGALYEGVVRIPDIREWKSLDDKVCAMHESSGLFDEVENSGSTLWNVIEDIDDFIDYYDLNGVPLAGSTVGFDRAFLQANMPHIVGRLHYRSIDVSTIKELVRRWHPQVLEQWEYVYAPAFKAHRALADVGASIQELKFYREELGL